MTDFLNLTGFFCKIYRIFLTLLTGFSVKSTDLFKSFVVPIENTLFMQSEHATHRKITDAFSNNVRNRGQTNEYFQRHSK